MHHGCGPRKPMLLSWRVPSSWVWSTSGSGSGFEFEFGLGPRLFLPFEMVDGRSPRSFLPCGTQNAQVLPTSPGSPLLPGCHSTCIQSVRHAGGRLDLPARITYPPGLLYVILIPACITTRWVRKLAKLHLLDVATTPPRATHQGRDLSMFALPGQAWG